MTRDIPIAWKAAAAVVLLAVALLSAASFVTSTPAVCARCHAADAASLAASPHHGASCYDCHLAEGPWSLPEAKLAEWFSMYPAALQHRPPPTAGVRISRAACLTCHDSLLKRTSVAHGLRIAHADCSPAPDRCDGCHADAGHPGTGHWARRADMASCLACHTAKKAPVSCSTCHKTAAATGRPGTGILGVAHRRGAPLAHALADTHACAGCHQGGAGCAKCHGIPLPHPASFLLDHGVVARKPNARCGGCHLGSSLCDACHGIAMPHPAVFLKGHGTVAKSNRDPLCLRCHRQSDCGDCHKAHQHPTRTKGSLRGRVLPASKAVP